MLRIIGVVIGLLVIGLVCLAVFLYLNSWIDWHPNKNSNYAVRARAVHSRLRIGMSEAQVRKLFREDRLAFPADMVDDSSNPHWERGINSWSRQIELNLYEPPYTMWYVDARFDTHGKLVQHRTGADFCCGL